MSTLASKTSELFFYGSMTLR